MTTSGELPLRRTSSWLGRLPSPLRVFVATEAGGASLLLAAAVLALAWANSPWGSSYETFWSTELAVDLGGHALSLSLREWVNDGLMTFFFFVIGLEIRRELDMGQLREKSRVALPVLAAIGGMTVPVLLYLSINSGDGSARGWGIVMATDTAFALGLLALAGGRMAYRARALMLTLVIVDDVAALLVIAVFYTTGVSVTALAIAALLFLGVLVLKRVRVWRGPAYVVLGFGIWLAMHESGVHPTIAGVALGLLARAYPPPLGELARVTRLARAFREQPTPEVAHRAWSSVMAAISPNERVQYRLHPWTSYVIVPLFAVANAGVTVDPELVRRALTSPITIGIVVGLVVGKTIGITLAAWLGTRRRLGGLPLAVGWPVLASTAAIAGIGFTVSLFVADLSFQGTNLEEAKLGILSASIAAAALGAGAFRVLGRLPDRLLARWGGRTVPPLTDLVVPVDPERDHVRGPAEAPVTLVEYGDYECPYCGRAEPVIRDLLIELGDELRYVFRHLPLTDVHPQAQGAAEAAEAAAAQDRFWQMHDLLFAHQDALDAGAVRRLAEQAGLDLDRFDADLDDRAYAARVATDTDSAADSGVAGTPTFFVNGQRHNGAFDIGSLRRAVATARRDPP
jgi:Na+/H+ antiporter NhaA